MRGVRERVGRRQWRVLLEAERAYPFTIAWGRLCLAAGPDLSPAEQRKIIDTLVGVGLLEDACAVGPHMIAHGCSLRITERGAGMRRGNHGGRPAPAGR